MWYDPYDGMDTTPEEPQSPAQAQKHVRYHTLDASACQLEWNVPATCPWRFKHAGTAPGTGPLPHRGLRGSGRYFPFDFLLPDVDDLSLACVSVMRWRLQWQYDGRVVFGKGHLHIGGIDLSLYREPSHPPATPQPQQQLQLLCRTSAVYGTGWQGHKGSDVARDRLPFDQPAGNEEGYVVEVSTCQDSFLLRKGDMLVVEARYHAAPGFEGVMGLMDLAVLPLDTPSKGDFANI
jgi:hypothetical protein